MKEADTKPSEARDAVLVDRPLDRIALVEHYPVDGQSGDLTGLDDCVRRQQYVGVLVQGGVVQGGHAGVSREVGVAQRVLRPRVEPVDGLRPLLEQHVAHHDDVHAVDRRVGQLLPHHQRQQAEGLARSGLVFQDPQLVRVAVVALDVAQPLQDRQLMGLQLQRAAVRVHLRPR